MKKILLTGGAGYIGSHILKNLLAKGYEAVIYDNLSTGNIEPIKLLKGKHNCEFIKGDLADKEGLLEALTGRDIDAVMHLAAKFNVGESVEKPDYYYQENYLNSLNLIEAMSKAGINKIIFSSTTAVYGNPEYLPVDENHPTKPISPYGQTKIDFEKYMQKTNNLKFIIFRYFNVGGSDPSGLIGKSHISSDDIIENVMKVALGQKEKLQVFGNDYDTKDGTPIRDFVHVEDIAQAHILAFEKINELSGEVFNLGSEAGFSIKEIIETAERTIGKKIPHEYIARRPGDIVVSVASSKKAKETLGWKPEYSDLETIIRTDWRWRSKHPLGYSS